MLVLLPPCTYPFPGHQDKAWGTWSFWTSCLIPLHHLSFWSPSASALPPTEAPSPYMWTASSRWPGSLEQTMCLSLTGWGGGGFAHPCLFTLLIMSSPLSLPGSYWYSRSGFRWDLWEALAELSAGRWPLLPPPEYFHTQVRALLINHPLHCSESS